MGLFKINKNPKDGTERFKIKHLPSLLVETGKAWSHDNPWRHSAIVAYYAILALPGLLVILITMLGYLWGTTSAEGQIYDEINSVMGRTAADSIQSIMENAAEGDSSLIATIIGIGALIFGATGVFFHLQISINNIWQVESDPKNQIVRYLIDRSKSFGFVLVIGFLMLISFVISALLMALQQYLQQWFPDIIFHLFWMAELIISFGVITLLFALIFKFLPDVHIGWRSVWIGALITSFLFALGKEVLSFYFGQSNPGSVYGAAGSIIIILLWVSYSCLILFYGAEFTWMYTRRYGIKFRPKSYAKFEKQQGNSGECNDQ
jgi:membrane protein